MSEEILVDVNPFETRVALLVDGALREVHVERPSDCSLRGNLYRGRVNRVVGGVQAAFVDIGVGRPGFLHVRDLHGVREAPGSTPPDISKLVRPGQSLLVQVAKDPLNGKGLRLTTNVTLAARTVVLLPFETRIAVAARIVDEDERSRLVDLVTRARDDAGKRHGYIARTACQTATEDQVRSEIEDLDRLWGRVSRRYGELAGAMDAAADSGDGASRAVNESLVHRELPAPTRIVRDLAGPATRAIVVNHADTLHRIADYIDGASPELADRVTHYEGRTPLFEARGLEAAIDRALEKRVRLPSGGSLVIEQTEAMTTIDVNSGSDFSSTDLESTAFRTNAEAAREIPAQLRLRNIGGIIVVDFIDMVDDDHRRRVMDALIDAASGDPARFRAAGFSELGLVEISRRRTHASLQQQLCDPCGACSGRAFAKSPQSACHDIFRALSKRAARDSAGVQEYLVRASQRVVDRLLDEEASYLATLERDLERPIRLQVEPGYTSDQFDLVAR